MAVQPACKALMCFRDHHSVTVDIACWHVIALYSFVGLPPSLTSGYHKSESIYTEWSNPVKRAVQPVREAS